MDAVTVRVGPIRGVHERKPLRDYCPITHRSRVTAGIRDLKAKRAILIQPVEKSVPVDEQLVVDDSASAAVRRAADATGRSWQTRMVEEMNIKNITGTGVAYAWIVRQVVSIPVSGPPETAGPLQPGRQMTLSNTLGNIIAYCSDQIIKVWVLRYVGDEVPAWVEANEGDPHPNADALNGYGLSMRNPNKPSWVKLKTLAEYHSKAKRKVGQVSR